MKNYHKDCESRRTFLGDVGRGMIAASVGADRSGAGIVRRLGLPGFFALFLSAFGVGGLLVRSRRSRAG